MRRAGSLPIHPWVKAGLLILGAFLALGAAQEAADRLWALHLRPRRDAVYSLLGQVHTGMTRDQVRAILDVPKPPYDWRREDEPEAITVFVRYSLFEGCYAFVEFDSGHVAGLSTSRSSEPGPCPGAPDEWGS